MSKIKYFAVAAIISAVVLVLPGLASAQTVAQTGVPECDRYFASGSNSDAMACIQVLTGILSALTAPGQQGGTPTRWCHTFNDDPELGVGSRGDEVAALQTALQNVGFTISNSHNEISNQSFGEDTASAVVQFQTRYGIRPTGYVGPITGPKLNALYGCGTTQPPPTAQMRLRAFPANVTLGQPFTTRLNLSGAAPQSRILFYLQRPDGSMKYNGETPILPGSSVPFRPSEEFTTDNSGGWDYTLQITPAAQAQTGTWTGWVSVNGAVSNKVYFYASGTQSSATLTVSLDPSTPPAANVSVGQSVRFTKVKFTASGGDAILGNVTVSACQNSPLAAFQNVFVFNDSVLVGSVPGLAIGPNGATVPFTASLTILNGSSTTLTIASNISAYTGYTGSLCLGVTGFGGNYYSGAGLPVYGNVMTVVGTAQPSITVLSPNGWESWQIGTTHFIQWQPGQGSQVSIALMSGNTTYGQTGLPIQTPNSGTYSWTIPATITPGSYSYVIKIACIGTDCDFSKPFYDSSNAPFTITAAGITQPSITVTPPLAGAFPLHAGDIVTIHWNTSYTGSTSFYYEGAGGQPTTFIRSVTGSAGDFNWTVPSGIYTGIGAAGGDWRIRGGNNYDGNFYSATFSIVAAGTTQPSITITSNPQADSGGNVTVHQGSQITISGTPLNVNLAAYGTDFTRAFFFDSIFTCTYNSAAERTWTMQCVASNTGTSRFYVEIYKNGQTYRSNVITVTVVPVSTTQPTITFSVSLDPSTPPAATVAPGQTNVAFTVAKFFASGGDVSVNQISPISDSASAASLKNISVYSGTTLLGSVASLANQGVGYRWGSINLSTPLVFPNGYSKILTIKSDVDSSASGVLRLGFQGFGYTTATPPQIGGSLLYGPVYGNSMTVGGATISSITVLSPNGGESWPKGELRNITWQGGYQDFSDEIQLISASNYVPGQMTGYAYYELKQRENLSGSRNSFTWVVGDIDCPTCATRVQGIPTGQYVVRIIRSSALTGAVVYYDDSNAPFTIAAAGTTQPSITVISPNGGETCSIGNTCRISWTYNAIPPENAWLALHVIKDGREVYNPLTAALNTVNYGYYDWLIPSNIYNPDITSGGSFKIRAKIYNYTTGQTIASDDSNTPFSIVAAGTAQPTVSVSPSRLDFTAQYNGSNPPAQFLSVSSNNVSWNVSAASTPSGWLSTSVVGTQSSNVSMSVYANQSGLSAGTYNGAVTISSAGNPAINVPVTLTVSGTAPTPTAITLATDKPSYNVGDIPTYIVTGLNYAVPTLNYANLTLTYTGPLGSACPYGCTQSNIPVNVVSGKATFSGSNPWPSSAAGQWSAYVSDGTRASLATPFTVSGAPSANTPVITGAQGYNASTGAYTSTVYANNYLILYGTDLSPSGSKVCVQGVAYTPTYSGATQVNVLLDSSVPGGQVASIYVCDAARQPLSNTWNTYITVSPTVVQPSTAPTLSVSPTSLSFTATRGTNPAPKVLTITSSNVFSWTLSSSPWLHADLSAVQQNNGAISVSVASSDLEVGTYNGSITISAGGSSVIVPVTLIVTAAPQQVSVSAAPASLNFYAQQGGASPADQTISVSATNASWSFTTFANLSGWLSVTSPAPNQQYSTNGAIAVRANSANLAAGTYSGNVQVSGNFGNSPIIIPITLIVSAASAQPVSVSFTANGSTYVNASVGDTVNFNWSAANAPAGATASSIYSVNLQDSCGWTGTGPFSWSANTLNGSVGATILPCQAGRTYTMTYTVQSSSGAVSRSVTVFVIASGANQNLTQEQQMANALETMKATLESISKSLGY